MNFLFMKNHLDILKVKDNSFQDSIEYLLNEIDVDKLKNWAEVSKFLPGLIDDINFIIGIDISQLDTTRLLTEKNISEHINSIDKSIYLPLEPSAYQTTIDECQKRRKWVNKEIDTIKTKFARCDPEIITNKINKLIDDILPMIEKVEQESKELATQKGVAIIKDSFFTLKKDMEGLIFNAKGNYNNKGFTNCIKITQKYNKLVKIRMENDNLIQSEIDKNLEVLNTMFISLHSEIKQAFKKVIQSKNVCFQNIEKLNTKINVTLKYLEVNIMDEVCTKNFTLQKKKQLCDSSPSVANHLRSNASRMPLRSYILYTLISCN